MPLYIYSISDVPLNKNAYVYINASLNIMYMFNICSYYVFTSVLTKNLHILLQFLLIIRYQINIYLSDISYANDSVFLLPFFRNMYVQ